MNPLSWAHLEWISREVMSRDFRLVKYHDDCFCNRIKWCLERGVFICRFPMDGVKCRISEQFRPNSRSEVRNGTDFGPTLPNRFETSANIWLAI
jgi:hypothetical protein